MTYSDATPHQRAALASVEARRRRAAERHASEARMARCRAHPGLPTHPIVCICDDCEALRSPESGDEPS